MVAYRQTYEIIRGIQEKAAEQCAPVIFGIKPSNLLIIDQCYAKALKSLVETTGLKVRCFEHRAKKQVWFLFREEALYSQLVDPDNRSFMQQFGYTEDMTMMKYWHMQQSVSENISAAKQDFLMRWEFSWDILSVMSKDLLNIMDVTASAVVIGKYMRMKKRPVRHFDCMTE